MGGNALKHLGLDRIDAREFRFRISKFAVIGVEYQTAYPNEGLKFGFPTPIGEKYEFGDIDVVYTIHPDFNQKFHKFLEEKFESRGSKQNGNVRSVEWKNFQVDLIFVQPEVFDWALHWYSHGDHSAVMGRVYRYYGYKFGWDGLYYQVKTKSFARDILVTRDWKAGNAILGYQPLVYECEYKEQDIFDHTASSPYAFAEIFDTVKMDRPRPSQVRFYEWVRQNDTLLNRRKYPRKFGTKLLRRFSIGLYFLTVREWEVMVLREFFNPIRRKIRKIRYKYFVAGVGGHNDRRSS